MNQAELKKLKVAAKSMLTDADTFSITGDDFSCRWNGADFIWTPPSGFAFKATAKEVVKYIADGSYIKNYCFSYGDDQSQTGETPQGVTGNHNISRKARRLIK